MILAQVFLWILFVASVIGVGVYMALVGKSREDYSWGSVVFAIIETLILAYILFWGGVFVK